MVRLVKAKRMYLLILTIVIALCSSPVSSAATKITLIVNGKQATAEVKTINSSTYIPLRAAAELLGATVNYDASAKAVYITSSDAGEPSTPTIAKSSKMTLVVNGVVAKVDPVIISSTTYVPVRAASELLGATVNYDAKSYSVTITKGSTLKYDVMITFPADRYPETAAHIASAIAKGESAICTIDRTGADENRSESLVGVPTKQGYDRDEFPMAMCAEGGAGADVAYVESSDNRGAGSWVGNQLEEYKDGTRVLFIISSSSITTPSTSTGTGSNNGTNGSSTSTPVYKNCTEARAAGVTPLHVGDPGYSTKLDRDGDGIACE